VGKEKKAIISKDELSENQAFNDQGTNPDPSIDQGINKSEKRDWQDILSFFCNLILIIPLIV
jgi:hypothetical protein